MSDAERFDAYYAESRDRLLVLAFALTGDLAASRGAVRASFVAAWHHWPGVRRLDDPGTWLRPHVWARAQGRHTARMWHRDRGLDAEVRATLDALAKLPQAQRKALLLSQLTAASGEEMAREVGLPLDDAEAGLATATTQFARHRAVTAAEVRPLLEQLADHCRDQRWPRATILRRAGTARRRTHAVVGAGLVVAALVGSGFLVTDQHGVHPTLAAAGDRLTDVPTSAPATTPSAPDGVRIMPSQLVSRAQLARALPGHAWRITGTDPKQGMTFPCQRRSYADPHATTALVRNFTARRQPHRPQVAVVQAMELSATEDAARAGFATANRWFSDCAMPQMQLVTVRRVQRLGDDAQQYVLRNWRRPTATFVLGVARTGRINTLTLTRTPGLRPSALGANLHLLGAAVDDLCPTVVAGGCSAHPRARTVPPPPAGTPPTMLSEFDLPAAARVTRPWVGTTPKQALQNVAATGCDRSSFHGPGWQRAATRSFLVPGARLAPSFGLTETVGRLPVGRAKTFVAGVRAKLASCPRRELGTRVLRLASTPTMAVWRVRTQVTNKRTLTFFMGIVRNGGGVAQVGFVPDRRHTLTTPQLVALVHRAGERLTAMPR